ncbi:YfjI family protein [Flavonifractor sp. An306]|uniref:YfjI family protein n=1 Tax=Flavonifractor sp. An306 TaxID=1965629 RepID=UPI003455BCE4
MWALPGPIRDYVEALSTATQTPPDMAGVLSLGVLAMTAQSRYTVQVAPDWSEPVCLYTVAVAPPGERKSAVISALTRPAIEYEAERRTAEAADVAASKARASALEKAHQAAENKFANGKATLVDVLNAAEEAAQASSELVYPYRILVDDATPEKLVDLMEQQDGCITVVSAEGGVFDMMAGRYDKTTNIDVYLKAHAGDPLTVDRIGRPPNHIPNPRLTMLLSVQPNIISGVMSNNTFRGRGLCGRYLYAICKSKVGHRDIDPPPVPENVKGAYRATIRRMLADQDGGTITLSPEANEIRREYQAHVERRLGPDGDLYLMKDWAGKLTGAMLRIAALLHVADCPTPTATPIPPEVMVRSTSIAECLAAHAQAAYGLMGGDQSQVEAKYLWRRIQAHGGQEISKRDLYRLCKGHFRKAEDMEPALSTLSDMGYVREVNVSTGGRPTTKILVNPL